MTQPAGSFRLTVARVDGYEMRVRFDKPEHPDLVLDEPPPLGNDHGPNPARVLAAAVASCLSASLLFCLNRAKIAVTDLRADVTTELVRNDAKRLRIGKIAVRLHPTLEDPTALAGCLEAFEDFCVVTQSVREGIDVDVSVD